MKAGDRVMTDLGPAVVSLFHGGQVLVRLVPFDTGKVVNGKPEKFTPAAPWRVRGYSELTPVTEKINSGVYWT